MTEGPGAGRHAAVVGAGIVGVSCGLALLRDGWRVTLIDRQGPGEGTSFGNGSVIAPDSVVPVATPGIAARVPRMLLDPLGPLRIRWGYLPRLAPWLWRFLRASSPERVEAIAAALAALGEGAVEAYEPLTALAGAGDMIKRGGWLCVFESEAQFQSYADKLALERRHGAQVELVPAEELRQLEPSLAPTFHCALYYPRAAHTVDNFRFVQVLAAGIERHGGRVLREAVTGFELGEGGVRAVRTDAGRHPCDAVVVAAGAWSRPLCRQLGSDPPLDTERGYHLTVAEPGVMPRLPVYSTITGMVCTPLEHGLRIAGTVELGGYDAPPDWRRAEVLMTNAKRWLPGLQGSLEDGRTSKWMGFRPSMPDSLPVISGSPHHRNAYFAFGHGHSGLGYGARTGALIAALMADRDPGIDMAAFRIDRF